MTMPQNVENNSKRVVAKVLALSSLVIFFLFYWQGSKGFNLWDEGFLWYGAQRVILGEVPIRDFMSYDPGRYYWSATLMSIIGDNGIMSLRVAVAIFQALGLFIGMLLIAQAAKNNEERDYLFWVVSAATLALWMFPRHKLFDISLSIFLVGVLTYLVQKPIPKRYFVTGLCVGLVATFGRNHGMYGFVGSMGAMLWLSIERTSEPRFFKGMAVWSMGCIAGYTPVLLMILLIPSFASSFFEGLTFLLGRGTTNLTLPVPWPWNVNFAALSLADSARGLFVGSFFLGLPVFGVVSVLWAVRQRMTGSSVSPAFASSAFLVLPYAHFAFSRADVGHLALGIFPMLLGSLIVLSGENNKIKWPLSILLFSSSFWVMHVYHPGWQCHAGNQCVEVEISGSDLLIDSGTANDVAMLRDLVAQYAANERSFMAAPFWPGAYALLNRKSPTWASYALWKRGADFEREEVERIRRANPGFVLIFDIPLDGREELRFKNSHPIIFEHIRKNYLSLAANHESFQLYVPKKDKY